jgi:beta-phosphoglucomutase-like phosphatase (HAD superfamily)
MIIKDGSMILKGIAYDLDGTIIDSLPVHERGWLVAAKLVDLDIPFEKLKSMKGIPDEEWGAQVIKDPARAAAYVKAKQAYVNEHIGEAKIFPEFFTTEAALRKKSIPVWIYTSSYRWFVKRLLEEFPAFRDIPIVDRDMVKKGKPDPEGILLTFSKMSIRPQEGIYVGDAYVDYLAAKRARTTFLYYHPGHPHDPRVPEDAQTITAHSDVLRTLSW